MWTLVSARGIIAVMETHLAPRGFHVALAGGVLARGHSKHDLDVVVFPHCKRPMSTARSREWAIRQSLRAAGLVRRRTWCQMHAYWRKHGSWDTKHVEVWVLGARRVDVIMLA